MVVPPASSVSEGVSPPGVSGPGFWPDTSDVGWGARLTILSLPGSGTGWLWFRVFAMKSLTPVGAVFFSL